MPVDSTLMMVSKLMVLESHLGPGLTIGAIHDNGPHRGLGSQQRSGGEDKGGARARPQHIPHLRTLLLIQLGYLRLHDCN